MMQRPYVADDEFERRVLARQARNRTLSATISNTVQRVKDSSRSSGFTRWAAEKREAALALSKTAAASMSAGLEKAWARIEKSPGAIASCARRVFLGSSPAHSAATPAADLSVW